MAIIDMDGYETGVVAAPNVVVSGALVAGTGRNGTGVAVRSGSAGDYLSRTIVSATDTIFFHTGTTVQPNSFNRTDNGADVFRVYADGGTVAHLSLNFDAAGHLTLRRGATTGTIIATSTLAFASVLQWRSFEIKVTIHDTTGECIVRVDGVEWINFTGDTRNGGTSTRPDRLHFGIGTPGNQFIDDFLCNDTTSAVNNTWPGEITIIGIRPANNGANSALVGSDGNSTDNYLLVDEYPLNTTDYNGSSVVGALDTYDLGALGKTGTVLGVQTWAYAVKSDAGAKSFKHVMRSVGGTLLKSSAVPLSTSYVAYLSPIYPTDADVTAWTVAKVNSAEFGFEVV